MGHSAAQQWHSHALRVCCPPCPPLSLSSLPAAALPPLLPSFLMGHIGSGEQGRGRKSVVGGIGDLRWMHSATLRDFLIVGPYETSTSKCKSFSKRLQDAVTASQSCLPRKNEIKHINNLKERLYTKHVCTNIDYSFGPYWSSAGCPPAAAVGRCHQRVRAFRSHVCSFVRPFCPWQQWQHPTTSQ